MKQFNIQHFKGKQYRYLMFLCDKKEKRRLLNECLIDLSLPRPKDDDLSWTVKDLSTCKWVATHKPPYVTDVDQKTKDLVKIKYARVCSVCGKGMNEGFCLFDGQEYYCSDECLATKYADEEYDALYDADLGYWTEWEETD